MSNLFVRPTIKWKTENEHGAQTLEKNKTLLYELFPAHFGSDLNNIIIMMINHFIFPFTPTKLVAKTGLFDGHFWL